MVTDDQLLLLRLEIKRVVTIFVHVVIHIFVNLTISVVVINKIFEGTRNIVIECKFGKIYSMKKETCPFEQLSANQLKEELVSRKMSLEFLKPIKKDILPVLKKELKGIKRVPILFFGNPLKDLTYLGLSSYEMTVGMYA